MIYGITSLKKLILVKTHCYIIRNICQGLERHSYTEMPSLFSPKQLALQNSPSISISLDSSYELDHKGIHRVWGMLA